MGDFQGHPFRGNQYEARLSIREGTNRSAGTTRDMPGFHITGTDTKGRHVKVFAETRAVAEHITAKIKEGLDIESKDFRPSIDQGILSPSGSASKASRDAALERARVELFGEKGLQREPVAQPSERERATRELKELRDLVERGMKVPGYRKRIQELERVVNGGYPTPPKDVTNRRDKLGNQIQKALRTGGIVTLPSDPFEGFRD